MLYESIKAMTDKEPREKFTVVVPTYNNPSYLKIMVKQLCDHEVDRILIVDNNSTIQGMKELLEGFSREFTVVSKKTNDGPTEFYRNKDFYAWLPDLFVITDPDIGFNKNLPRDFLQVMKETSDRLNMFRVGFALDIEMHGIESNIREIKFRPAKMSMHEWESQFWRKKIAETR